MAWPWIFGGRSRMTPHQRGNQAAAVTHLEEFVATHRGIEAFLEMPTSMARASLLLVAYDGEWTRRSVASVAAGRQFAQRFGLPVYDAAVVGYPQRMRDFNARSKGRRHPEP